MLTPGVIDDDIIKDIPCKLKCVDNTRWWHRSILFSSHLQLCWTKGIVLNPEIFQFCVDIAQLEGLQISPTGLIPSKKLLASIRDFPVPKDITDARSWFGLVNKVVWAYSISPIMQPFRLLVNHNSKFYWDETIHELFNDSKKLLITVVQDGIRFSITSEPRAYKLTGAKPD